MYGVQSMQSIAQTLLAQQSTKADYLATANSIRYEKNQMILPKIGEFEIQEHAHFQQMEELNQAFGLRLSRETVRHFRNEAPHLTSAIWNDYFPKLDKRVTVRTLEGKNRAFLSDRYRALDNYDLMTAILPTLQEKQLVLQSCNLSDEKLYLKATMPMLRGEVRVEDVVEMGIVISNSEIGMGSVTVKPLIYRLVCKNGLISDSSLRKYHVQKANKGFGDDVNLLLSDNTRMMEDQAFWSGVRDIVKNSLSEEFFDKELQKMKKTTEVALKTATPQEVALNITKNYLLNEEEGQAIFANLLTGGDFSQWGVVNAVTAVANETDSYEKATRLETIGGEILTLSPTEWEVLDSHVKN